ncbi:probable aspartic proteinase GIP2 [Impatiens glandulifera]|uniref:probable aspartic proteinase GIP2 n=1 Tax=Impatiens glandulifera TaxID=253017 RepID=UPI001FB0B674|nr:probable aspartic proteinase GIP2 [Impatiens glandulifera]
MAPTFSLLVYFSLIFVLYHHQTVNATYRPQAIVLPVTKDPKTLQYLTQIKQRTPLVPLNLTVDLGGQSLWVDCDNGYTSSSYRSVRCGSALCKLSLSGACGDCFAAPKPGCNKNTCGVLVENSVTRTATSGELAKDVVSVQSTNGINPGPSVLSSARFPFTCGSTSLLSGLAKGVKGMVGLGRTNISIPTQLALAFRFHRTFAMCLTSTGSKGVIFFGHSPYSFLPGIDVSKRLIYTPLIINPVSTAAAFFEGNPSSDYFIRVLSIKFNGLELPINKNLFSIDKEGNGGTKISTVTPYTMLETSIYKAVAGGFGRFAKAARVKAVNPFSICYNSSILGSTRVGAAVPQLELLLAGNSSWSIFGANSLVNVNDDVACLAFMDGGSKPKTSIVIGGHQIENNLLQFDLGKSRLGFSSSLLFYQTTCANFNFTSTDNP